MVVMDGNDNVTIGENVCNLKYIRCMPRSEAIFTSCFFRVVYIWNILPPQIKCMDMDNEDTNKNF